jgi:Flp pilus assembly protein TadD
LVRTAALQALEPLAAAGHDPARQTLQRKLTDPARAVRVTAAWAMRETLEPNSEAARDLAVALDHGADQPGGQLQLAHFALAKGDQTAALLHAAKAVAWDGQSSDLRREYAVILSSLGRSREALVQMKEAVRLSPKDADLQQLLGLAWNEAGDLNEAIRAFTEATQLDPKLARAWYNLGLAKNQTGDPTGALTALRQGELADPSDARLPFARATIHARLGDVESARAAATKARDRGSEEAAQLLKQLGR